LIPFFGALVVGLLWWGAALTASQLNYAIAVFVVIPAYIFWFRRSGNSNRMTTGR
jgi:Flp pilus assembly protein TadB